MQLGVRAKLFLVSLGLIAVGGGASFVFLEQELRGWLVARVETNVVEHARMAREAVVLARSEEGPGFDELADRIGAAGAARITIVAADGRVLGDSELSPEQIAQVDNHGRRPEVLDAKARGVGKARRYSTTLDTDMIYVALPFARGTQEGFVRAAVPLRTVDQLLGRLRIMLLGAALVGLAIAVVMSWLASSLMSRTLGRLVDACRRLSGGDGNRIDISWGDELGNIAGSFNRLAEDLERTVRALAAERDRFEVVLEGMGEGLLVLERDLKISLSNPAARALLSLGPHAMGSALETITGDCPGLTELARRGLDGDATSELAVDGPRGERRLLARATPLAASGGTVIVLHDVTDMRRLENVRKDFVANVSHELRTPVSVIRANAETLLDGALEDSKRARGFVEALHRNSERLTRIISDLLDLSSIEAGSYRLELEFVNAASAALRAMDAVAPKAEARGIHVELEAQDTVEAYADAKALDHVLLNLLDNAIKYTPAGGRVTLRVNDEGKDVRFEVEDDGPGVPPEHRDRIFERFYRVDPGRSRDMGGTGLGLAIVKHLVESMDGRVTMTAAPERGSIFRFLIPAGPVRTVTPGRTRPDPSKPAEPETRSTDPGAAPASPR